MATDVHLVLDTEMNGGNISGDQLTLLKEVEQKAIQGGYQNVFIYGHRTVWSETYTEMEGLFQDNTRSLTGTNYETEVLPILTNIGKHANVYWFSGSLGTAPASFFYFYDQSANTRIIATAIRSLPRDAMLWVRVNPMGEVSFETHSLTGQDLLPLEQYDFEFWQNEVGAEPFNWKLIPYYFELMLTHRYFWYGVLWTIAGGILVYFLRKIYQKRSARKAA